jgi:DNA mismatch repair protein MutL
MNYCQIIIDFADQYINFETFKDPSEIKESFITTMACRTAIKAGDNLNLLEMESLVKDLFRCDNPYTCPHGRPTVFRMNYEELAKKFLRR